MPNLYFEVDFDFELFATDSEDKKELAKKGEKSLDWFVLNYQGGPDHSEADYGISIYPSDFTKGSDFGMTTDGTPRAWAKGVAKINAKADLFQYLMEDKSPQFFFSHVKMVPYAYLYADKKGKPVPIKCTYSKTKPK